MGSTKLFRVAAVTLGFLSADWSQFGGLSRWGGTTHYLSVGIGKKSPMIEFCSLNSRALLPTFRTNCPHGSRFVQMGSNFAQNNTTSSCSLLSHHQPLSKICTYTKHAQTHPKTPLFLSWTCQWAKWTTVHPSWGPFCLKSLSGQNIFRNEQKKISSQNNLCGVLNSF